MVGLFAFIAFARQRRLDSGIRSGDRNQQYRFSMGRPWASGADSEPAGIAQDKEDLRQLGGFQRTDLEPAGICFEHVSHLQMLTDRIQEHFRPTGCYLLKPKIYCLFPL